MSEPSVKRPERERANQTRLSRRGRSLGGRVEAARPGTGDGVSEELEGSVWWVRVSAPAAFGFRAVGRAAELVPAPQ